ncbi:MAG: hypothetical protein KGQ59_07285 [Bdellovibrionales bacterium]|nr:hypothetical protein [Bdellovibrionales bacterium]
MKFQWRVSGKKFIHDSKTTQPSEWRVTPRPGGWVLAERTLADGTVERVRGVVVESSGKRSAQWRECDQFSGPYFGEWQRVEADRKGGTTGVSAADFTAQFPGKVRKVLVAEGAAVTESQKLLLVEAMKMEFSIQAPCAGIVKRIRVTEGQQLSPGDLMLDFEEKPSG